MPKLCPSQQEAFDHLLEAFPKGSVFVVWGATGMGKTTMLQELHRMRGGAYLTMKSYVDELRKVHPIQMEETLEQMLMNTLDRNEMVILDDLNLLYDVMCGCGYNSAFPRKDFIEAILTSVTTYAVAADKTLVFGNQGNTPGPIANRSYQSGVKKLKVKDYSFIVHSYLGKVATALDFEKIHRFAPKLNGYHLKMACTWLSDKPLDTDSFIEYLRSQRMASNVDLGEVEGVEFSSLKGLSDVIESLEANIIVPLENDALATEFNIRPKRGVLLAGPPGTGKTTVGRALAHRLKSKFFLIDGTFISGSPHFYSQIQQVFEAAKNNAPSIIFIDDSDVIFEDKEDFGLYRYLLTMLDGLESKSNKRVCIMMTTMDVGSVPPALVRSGRIELWLETRLPDYNARLAILEDRATSLPESIKNVNLAKLAEDSEDLTGADLRRVIEDGKILIAYDKSRNLPIGQANDYFERSIQTIRENKSKYEAAEARGRKRAAAAMSGGRRHVPGYAAGNGGDDDDADDDQN